MAGKPTGMMSRLKSLLTAGRPMVIIGVALLVAIILILLRPSQAPAPRPERAWVVDVMRVEKGPVRPTLELLGQVQSPQDARLRAGIESEVMEVRVRDGESVEAGQVMALLDARDAQLALQQQEADVLENQAKTRLEQRRLERSREAFKKEQELLELTRSRADRAEEIFEQGLLSQSDLETASENLKRQQLAVNQAELTMEESEIRLLELSAQLSRAEALRDQAKLDIERTQITAPFSGVISELAISSGDRVRVGDELMRLQNPESIEVRAQIPGLYAESVADALAEGVFIDARVQFGGQEFVGSLVRISGQTREGSGGVDSFIGFSQPPRGLRLGGTVRALVELPPEMDVVAVPAEAMYGRNRLYTVEADRMSMLEVQRVGERQGADGRTEVLVRSEALSADDQVIITKLSNAADGLLVRVTGTGRQAAAEDRPNGTPEN